MQRLVSVEEATSQIFQGLFALEQCFGQNDFVQLFTASLGNKQNLKAFPRHTLFLELQTPLQKRLKTVTLQNSSQSTDQLTSKFTCSLQKLMNRAVKLFASGLGFQVKPSWDDALIFREHPKLNQFYSLLSTTFAHGWTWNRVIKNAGWLNMVKLLLSRDVACSHNGYIEIFIHTSTLCYRHHFTWSW